MIQKRPDSAQSQSVPVLQLEWARWELTRQELAQLNSGAYLCPRVWPQDPAMVCLRRSIDAQPGSIRVKLVRFQDGTAYLRADPNLSGQKTIAK